MSIYFMIPKIPSSFVSSVSLSLFLSNSLRLHSSLSIFRAKPSSTPHRRRFWRVPHGNRHSTETTRQPSIPETRTASIPPRTEPNSKSSPRPPSSASVLPDPLRSISLLYSDVHMVCIYMIICIYIFLIFCVNVVTFFVYCIVYKLFWAYWYALF